MKIPVNTAIIPENIAGKAVDIEQQITLKSVAEAISVYQLTKEKLLTPSIWHQLTGAVSAAFEVWNVAENKEQLVATVNDYIKIDIPGPGASAGEGYDWVKIELIQQNALPDVDDSLAMRLRACANPNKSEAGVAHFFKQDATSTFIIQRIANTVMVSYHGRNEIPNTKSVPLVDKIRNTLVATGAEVGLSELQWDSLLKGLLKK